MGEESRTMVIVTAKLVRKLRYGSEVICSGSSMGISVAEIKMPDDALHIQS
jgi:hypothetical protein